MEKIEGEERNVKSITIFVQFLDPEDRTIRSSARAPLEERIEWEN